MRSKIDYRYLKAFYYTAHFLNFSKAAEKLSVAQSAVSRQVKLLEDSMGEQLIVRSSKKVILTDKGAALFKAIESFEDTTTTLIQGKNNQILRVGILHGLLESWFIQVIKDFTKKTQHELRIKVDTPATLKQGLYRENFDIIFTNENIQNELLTSLALFEEKLVIISKKEIDASKIDQYTWITYGEADYFFNLYQDHSDRIISVNSITSIIKFVEEGIGIAIVPSHTLNSKSKLHTIALKDIKRPKVYLSTLNYITYPPHLKSFIDVVKNYKL